MYFMGYVMYVIHVLHALAHEILTITLRVVSLPQLTGKELSLTNAQCAAGRALPGEGHWVVGDSVLSDSHTTLPFTVGGVGSDDLELWTPFYSTLFFSPF